MKVTMNTNVASLNAQRNLAKITAMLGGCYRRLSSGSRIDKASDDAAGLAISERMRARIRSLTRAQLNANDGISMAQTAEGALNEVSAMLIRMRELAVQASNGGQTASDLSALNDEFTALIEEITRIAEGTNFNRQSLLNADQAVSFQVGDGINPAIDMISLDLEDMRAAALGIDSLSIDEGSDIQAAIDQVDTAINDVTSFRGDLGGFINRMSSTIRYLGDTLANLSASESRIRDADMAHEVAELTRCAIIQNAAVYVLQQANNQPQLYLELLL